MKHFLTGSELSSDEMRELIDLSLQLKAERDIRVFVAEKNWEGCGGLTMTDEVKVTIAAQIAIVTLADDAYPRALLEIADPPALLYACGRLELLAHPALAVVGSRNASDLPVDDLRVPGIRMPQNAFNKGDGINFSIAAASIPSRNR